MINYMTRLGVWAALMLGCTSFSHAAVIEYTAGHADIGVAIEDGDLHLHYHFGSDAVLDGVALGSSPADGFEYEASDIVVRVADSQSFFVSDPPHSSVGLGPGPGTVWVLPQSNVGGIPFLGFATEDLGLGAANTLFSLVGMSGPGNFALWSAGTLGSFNVYWDSVDGFVGDGLTLPAATHSHYNWGFTAAGVYELDIQASHNGMTDTQRFTFLVGDETQLPSGSSPVPEPTSLALAGIGALTGVLGLRRRKVALQKVIGPALNS